MENQTSVVKMRADRILKSIRDNIPPGYVLGRTGTGDGPVGLIKIDDLISSKFGSSAPITVHDTDIIMSDVTTNDVSTTKHGFAPKAPNDATKFLDGTGAYSVPAGTVTTATAVSFHPGFQSGRYYGPPYVSTAGTMSIAANVLYVCPFYCPVQTTFTKMSFYCSTLAAGKSIELGVYDNVNGIPEHKEYDCGNISVGSTGLKEITGLALSLAPGWHFLVAASDGTPQIYSFGSTTLIGWLIGNPTLPPAPQLNMTGSWTYSANALPSTFGSVTYGTSVMPALFLRL